MMRRVLLLLLVAVGAQEQHVEIPITAEIKTALLAANPTLFGSFDAPTRAACRCRLEPLDLTPYKARRYRPPASHPDWEIFIGQQQAPFTSEQYDPQSRTISWHVLEEFQAFLKARAEPQLPLGDLLGLVANDTLDADALQRRAEPAGSSTPPSCARQP